MTDAPIAARRPTVREHHGHRFEDPYEWLREKESPEVIAHLQAENAHSDAATAHLAPLRERIFGEIKSRTLETDLSVPVREGGWWYFGRSIAGAEYGEHCRVPVTDADDWTPPQVPEPDGDAVVRLPGEEVLLDENAEAEGHDFFALGSFDVSQDGRLLLWAVDTEGDERYTLRIRDLGTGETLPDLLEETAGGSFFDPSGRYVFSTTVDEAWRPDTVWRHEVGTDPADDVRVFHEPDERYWVGAGLTRSNRFLLVELGSKITSETLLLDAGDPTGDFAPVWPREEGVEYDVEHAVIDGEDRLLIVHNRGALDFELVSVPAADPLADPLVLVPHREGVRLESVDAFAGQLALEYRREALPRVAVARLDGSPLAFDELTTDGALDALWLSGNPEWSQPALRLSLGGFTTPRTVLDLDVASGERTVLKQQPVLGGYDPAEYESSRDWAVAEDGTLVPISLVWRRDALEDGPAPTLLYGYGSYEHSIDPGFSIPRLSLLDRGVVFAIAHVRGGGELGRAWYEHGKTLTKVNTFTDFVAVARHLVASGRTTPEQLVAEGGSAGGLLMGAVANLAPEAFAGILAAVPFVDPLTSILDPSLPLTVIEWDEWGDPLHDPAVYEYMAAYSPYENVRADADYPRILAVTSLNDTRVLYVEPAKWTARLREVGAPVLLKTEMSAGHGGVSGRYESWKERAFELAWMLEVLGRAD